MKVEARPEFSACVFTPEGSDLPEDLEDEIHDELTRERAGARPAQVILDLSGVTQQGPWLKAAGPEIPNANLRVALGPVGYQTARALRLDAHFEWYPDVESALRSSQ